MKKNALRLATLTSFAAALSAAGSSARAAPIPPKPPGPGIYSFDFVVAPVCLDGSFPLTITTSSPTPLAGTLTVTTDVRGRLSGSLTIGGETFAVSGTARSGASGFKIAMTAKSGRDRISFAGTLTGHEFDGSADGTGAVAAGKNTFAMDVSGAQPETATLVANLVAGRHGSLKGAGTLDVCGPTLPVKASGVTGKAFRVTAAGKGFKFKGSGPYTVTWSFKGFGASASGTNLAPSPVPAPSGLAYSAPAVTFEEEEQVDPDFPAAPMPPLTTYTVQPALPDGLVLDAKTGFVNGTPTTATSAADFVVTATNPAGSTQATVNIGVRINRSKSFAVDADALTDDDLRHFLRRTQWGVRQSELDALHAGGLSAYVDAMLVFPSSTTAETNANALLVNSTDPAGSQGQFPSQSEAARWWEQIMVETPAPFQETLAFFWHDHFGVSDAAFDGDIRFMVQHANLLRHEGAGNLRTLLLDVARDPAMLKFLNGVDNQKAAPNENFAREFWELFTLGVDNGYTQADITQAARAWTGYRERSDPVAGLNDVVLDLTRHDAGAKTILGQTIAAQNTTDDYAAVVDITLQQGKVAEFITTKLFEYFCYESPPQTLVDTMAANLRGANYELTPFLKSLFTSEAFFSKKARRALVKNPLEFTIGFIRSTGLKPVTTSPTPAALDVASLDTSLTNQAQRPTQPPTVAGWPKNDRWLSAQSMVERINVSHVCIDDTTDQARLSINVANILPPVAQRTADAVVDSLALLLDVQLSTQDRADLVAYLGSQRDSSGNVTSSPFDGSNQQQLDERVRGLLYILAQHPTYHSK